MSAPNAPAPNAARSAINTERKPEAAIPAPFAICSYAHEAAMLAIAPINIMPSTPRFRWPDFSVRISPKVPSSNGVPANTAATNRLMKSKLMRRPPFRGTQACN